MQPDDDFHSMQNAELRGVIDDLGLSNAEFRALIGVSSGTLSRWIGGAAIEDRCMVAMLRLLRSDPRMLKRFRQALAEPGLDAELRGRGRPPKAD